MKAFAQQLPSDFWQRMAIGKIRAWRLQRLSKWIMFVCSASRDMYVSSLRQFAQCIFCSIKLRCLYFHTPKLFYDKDSAGRLLVELCFYPHTTSQIKIFTDVLLLYLFLLFSSNTYDSFFLLHELMTTRAQGYEESFYLRKQLGDIKVHL